MNVPDCNVGGLLVELSGFDCKVDWFPGSLLVFSCNVGVALVDVQSYCSVVFPLTTRGDWKAKVWVELPSHQKTSGSSVVV